ncbi:MULTISPECIES: hypothetical protein [Delftia]|uniref:hypothetical protein n=1 Tax=Delftia TaxID=80865 RepID=UPI00187BC259
MNNTTDRQSCAQYHHRQLQQRFVGIQLPVNADSQLAKAFNPSSVRASMNTLQQHVTK